MSDSSSSTDVSRRRKAHLTKRVGAYLVGRTIGEGTYAKVKYAQHAETGKAFALKVLSKDLLISRGMVEQVKREVGILKQLKHPNVVNLEEVMSSKDKIFMVMELVTGGDLFDKIAVEGPLKEYEARQLFSEILSAVTHCHKLGICHRDLKPENVLLTSEGVAKLSDFGLGIIHTSSEEASKHSDLLNTVCGTPNYAAPEVISRKRYNGEAADVWSLGVLLYVMLAGCLPFDEDNIVTLFEKISVADYAIPPWISVSASEMIHSMLQVDPQARPAAAQLWEMSWMKENQDVLGGRNSSVVELTDLYKSEMSSGNNKEVFIPVNGVDTTLRGLSSKMNLSQVSLSRSDSISTSIGQDRKLNAFDLINEFLDISAIFELKDDLVTRHTQFTSPAPTADIFDEMEQAVVALGGRTEKRTNKILKILISSLRGPIRVNVSVLKLPNGEKIVDLQKTSGNTVEFYKWYSDLIGALSLDVLKVQSQQKSVCGEKAVLKKMNAFELISRNVNLGAIFELDEDRAIGHVQFSSKAPSHEILLTIQQGTLALGGEIEHSDLEHEQLELIAPIGGGRGMRVTVRILEVLSGIRVVQISKHAGSMLDLCKFYNKLSINYLTGIMMRRKDGRVVHPKANAFQSFVSRSSSATRTRASTYASSNGTNISTNIDSVPYTDPSGSVTARTPDGEPSTSQHPVKNEITPHGFTSSKVNKGQTVSS